jgi:DNA adenine methylase
MIVYDNILLMQTSLFQSCDRTIVVPPKSQLLKWIGNKQRFAVEIASWFPKSFEMYYEPFLGSGAVLATLAPRKALGSDVFQPLVDIWKSLVNDPESVKQWYDSRWNRLQQEDKASVYRDIREAYNRSPNGADLLFLSRACYGGVVRFRQSDGYMSTPCGIHDPIPPRSFHRRVDEWFKRVHYCSFEMLDYREAMNRAVSGDLIYCDPPYHHSQSILYGAQSFNIHDLFEQIRICKERGVFVALSIDGVKKSGKHDCHLDLPSGLFEREVFIQCGRSMLKRFQMNGQTLESEEVSDRLLLSY